MDVISTVLLDDAPGWIGRADITVAADGTWILVYRHANSHRPVSGSRYVIRLSPDEGHTWSEPNRTIDGDPIVGFPYDPVHDTNDAIVTTIPTGDLLFFSGDIKPDGPRLEPRQLRSSDDGRHWSDEGSLPVEGYSDTVRSLKPQDIAHQDGTVYLAHHVDPGGNRSRPFHSGLTASTDGGRSWRYVGDITSPTRDTNEVGLATIDGELIAMVRDMDARHTWLARSADGGKSWTIEDVTPQLGVFQRAKLATTPANDHTRLIAYGRHHVTRDDRRNAIAYSDDAGRTWFGPLGLDNGLSDTGYNGLLVRADGTVYTVIYRGDHESADLYGVSVTLE